MKSAGKKEEEKRTPCFFLLVVILMKALVQKQINSPQEFMLSVPWGPPPPPPPNPPLCFIKIIQNFSFSLTAFLCGWCCVNEALAFFTSLLIKREDRMMICHHWSSCACPQSAQSPHRVAPIKNWWMLKYKSCHWLRAKEGGSPRWLMMPSTGDNKLSSAWPRFTLPSVITSIPGWLLPGTGLVFNCIYSPSYFMALKIHQHLRKRRELQRESVTSGVKDAQVLGASS